jgi:hypothetical protein
VSWSRTMTNSAASVTAGVLYVNRTALINNSTAVSSADEGVSTATDLPSGYLGFYSGYPSETSLIWNTALFGTTLCLCGSATYASGTTLAQCTLKITLL